MINSFLPYFEAFAVGGSLCAIAQVLIDRTRLTPARILVGYVVCGVFLGALGIYKYISDFGGAGASVPLTGFGYLISEGVKKAVDERGFLGAFTGSLTAAAGGTAAALVFGLVASLCTRSKPKR